MLQILNKNLWFHLQHLNIGAVEIMANEVKPGKSSVEETQGKVYRINITLSSNNVKSLEKGIPICVTLV